MEMKELIARINALAAKAKTPEGLTPEETEERAALRQEYLGVIRQNFKQQLENIYLVDENGNEEQLKPGDIKLKIVH